MAQRYFPFDSGQGGNVTEAQWQKMAKLWMETGVINGQLNELQAFADSTGMQVKVKSGQAWIEGHFYESDAEETLSIGPADSTNPRIDRVIVRLDWIENTIQLAVLQGAPAVSPNPPAMTQNSSRWEIPVAKVRVNANANTIEEDKITDERLFVHSDIDISAGSTSQSISPNVNTKLTNLNYINRDRAYEWDNINKKIVIKKSGTYLIDSHLQWSSGENGREMTLKIYVNGEEWNTPIFNASMIGANDTDGKGTTVRPFKEGDVIEFYVSHTMSSSKTINISRITCTKLV